MNRVYKYPLLLMDEQEIGTVMPDWHGESDDDEVIEPWYNDTGDFGPGYIEEDDE